MSEARPDPQVPGSPVGVPSPMLGGSLPTGTSAPEDWSGGEGRRRGCQHLVRPENQEPLRWESPSPSQPSFPTALSLTAGGTFPDACRHPISPSTPGGWGDLMVFLVLLEKGQELTFRFFFSHSLLFGLDIRGRLTASLSLQSSSLNPDLVTSHQTSRSHEDTFYQGQLWK